VLVKPGAAARQVLWALPVRKKLNQKIVWAPEDDAAKERSPPVERLLHQWQFPLLTGNAVVPPQRPLDVDGRSDSILLLRPNSR
jgi:hypothetical protein